MAEQRFILKYDKTLTTTLGYDGNIMHYVVEPEVVILGGNQMFPFGMGDYTTGVSNPSYISIKGGVFDHTTIGGGNNIAIPLYGGSNVEADIDIDKLYARGIDCWGIQTDGFRTNIKVKELYCEGLVAYSSGTDGGITSNRIFEVDHLRVVNNRVDPSVDAGAIRLQRGDGFLAGTTETIKVGTVRLTGTKAHSTFYFQADTGGTGGSFNVDIGSIYNETPASTPYADYEKISNNSEPMEIQFAGGSLSAHTDVLVTVNADTIQSTQGIVSFQGTEWGTGCRAHVTVANGISTGQAAIFAPHPNMSGADAEIIVEGNYRSDATACGILAITNGKMIFRNCRFETTVAGKECIQISDDTVDDIVIFENCTFVNDGVTPSIGTNAVSPVNIIVKDCVTNSYVGDSNINVVGTLHYDPNL